MDVSAKKTGQKTGLKKTPKRAVRPAMERRQANVPRVYRRTSQSSNAPAQIPYIMMGGASQKRGWGRERERERERARNAGGRKPREPFFETPTPDDGHRYYYHLVPQYHNDSTKRWATTLSRHLPKLFKNSPEWSRATKEHPAQYSDYDSPIKNFFQTRQIITRKAFQARTWVGQEGWPLTLLVERGRMTPLSPAGQEAWDADEPAKWYLKPSNEHGGQGIIILRRPQEAKKYFRDTVGRGPIPNPGEEPTGPITYVLQKGVTPLLLYHEHKFDLRVWLLVTFKKGHFQFYLYRDAFIKIATRPYRENSTDYYMNLTNVSFQRGHHGDLLKTEQWSQLPFYELTFPAVQELLTRFMGPIRDQMRNRDDVGFEIIGFDVIFDEDYRPYVLELNRYLGYPCNTKNQRVNRLIYEMFRDTFNLAVKPNIYDDVPPRPGRWLLLDLPPSERKISPVKPVMTRQERREAARQAKKAAKKAHKQDKKTAPPIITDISETIPTGEVQEAMSFEASMLQEMPLAQEASMVQEAMSPGASVTHETMLQEMPLAQEAPIVQEAVSQEAPLVEEVAVPIAQN